MGRVWRDEVTGVPLIARFIGALLVPLKNERVCKGMPGPFEAIRFRVR